MFSIFRPTRVAKWIVLPWVQRHGWILPSGKRTKASGQLFSLDLSYLEPDSVTWNFEMTPLAIVPALADHIE